MKHHQTGINIVHSPVVIADLAKACSTWLVMLCSDLPVVLIFSPVW